MLAYVPCLVAVCQRELKSWLIDWLKKLGPDLRNVLTTFLRLTHDIAQVTTDLRQTYFNLQNILRRTRGFLQNRKIVADSVRKLPYDIPEKFTLLVKSLS